MTTKAFSDLQAVARGFPGLCSYCHQHPEHKEMIYGFEVIVCERAPPNTIIMRSSIKPGIFGKVFDIVESDEKKVDKL